MVCSVYGKCGGCKYLHISYDEQLKMKEEKVLKAFKENEINIENYEGIHPSPRIYGYRNKMEYSFGNEYKDGPLVLGLRARGKWYDVYYTKDCLLVDEDFNTIVEFTREYFLKENIPFRNYKKHQGYLRHLVVRKGIKTGEILLNIVTSSEEGYEKYIQEWKDRIVQIPLKGNIVSINHTITDAKSTTVLSDKYELIYGREYFIDQIFDLKFKIGPFSFFQTNTLGAEKLYEIVLNHIENIDTIFDLFAGTGTIGMVLSKKAKKVISVEINKEAVEFGKKTAKENNITNIEFHAEDVNQFLKTTSYTPEIVVFDPPRPGIQKKNTKMIKKFKFKKIIYVSCNYKTLIEDIKEIKDMYKLTSLQLMDMFPHTDHIESIALLEIK